MLLHESVHQAGRHEMPHRTLRNQLGVVWDILKANKATSAMIYVPVAEDDVGNGIIWESVKKGRIVAANQDA